MVDFDRLKSRLEIPGVVTFVKGNGGLPAITITAPHADAVIYLHGASVTAYTPHNQKSLLFCSRTSYFQPDKPIRGGVPIIFPWFGPHPTDPAKSQHGFARVSEWEAESTALDAEGIATVVFVLSSSSETREIWPHDFLLRYTVKVGPTLDLSLEVTNPSGEALTFDEALHTYLAVSDVRMVRVEGLENAQYIDKADGNRRKKQGQEPVTITAETDRNYLDTESACRIVAPGEPTIEVAKEGSRCTVVWNPWEKAETMADLSGGQWPHMLCVETVNAADFPVRLEPGATHRLRAVLSRNP